MIPQKYLKLGTIALIILLGGVLVWAIANDTGSAPTNGDAPSAAADRASLTMGTFGQSRSTPVGSTPVGPAGEAAGDPAAKDSLTLRVGQIGGVPERGEITMLDELPQTDLDVRRQYNRAKLRACRVVTPGVAVSPPMRGRQSGTTGSLGRVNALTIGLELDQDGRARLPTVVRGQVISYLEKHRLCVQPVVFFDANQRLYFGTDCQAAFYELDRPGTTVSPEPMIDLAVSRFRALGVVGSSDDAAPAASVLGEPVLGRTLAMAFTFEGGGELISGVASNAAARESTELLLLHLPAGATVDNFRLNVFVTKNDRTELHLLDTESLSVNSPLPTIRATVRFDKMVLLGMYPAEPVVSGIDFRSQAVLPMSVLHQLTGSSSTQTPQSLTEVLDQFGELNASPGRSNDQDWIQRTRREKERQLDQALQPRSSTDQTPPSVKRMTGLN